MINFVRLADWEKARQLQLRIEELNQAICEMEEKLFCDGQANYRIKKLNREKVNLLSTLEIMAKTLPTVSL